MRIFLLYCLVVVVVFLFLSSCAVLRSGSKIGPDFDVEAKKGGLDSAAAKEGFEETAADSGWAARYIPGWRRLSKILPPPTEARKKWDSRRSPSVETQDADITGWY